MSVRSRSRTALFIAAYRARATEAPQKLCDDPWARELAGDEGFDLARRYDEHYPPMELWVALRTGFIDARVIRALSAPWSMRQVVLLGAGLDTRAARLASYGGGQARFFEVDHPESQADKLARLGRLQGYPRGAAAYVACDFEHQDFVAELARAGFQADAPAIFVWEGVTPYLTEAAVRSTLHRIAHRCEGKSVVVFDHIQTKLVLGHVDASDRLSRQMVDDLNEPIRWGTNDVLPVLYQEGFRKVRVSSFDEICLSETGTYERERKFRFQNIAVASRAAQELP